MASLAAVNNNGINYVNSSGQPTTLSTFVFDGTNVGIGTASPNAKLQVSSSTDFGAVLKVSDTSSESTGFVVLGNGNSTDKAVGIWRGAANSVSSSGTFLNLGGYGGMAFSTGAALLGSQTERMRIDSSGNLLVGTTSSGFSERFNVVGSVNSYLARNNNSNASPSGYYIQYSAASPNGTGNEFLRLDDSTTNRVSIRSNGGIANYSANNVNLSDRREKTNFAPAGDYLAKICAIPVQTFNYVDQNLEEDDGLTLGVVAQDVQAVAPELVMESNWAAKDDEPKMRLSIYQTDLQYALMKCIQEQQALIQSLTTRITALEAK